MEEFFSQAAHIVASVLEFISVVVISLGAVSAIVRCGFPLPAYQSRRLRGGWHEFATWLLFGLEFTLAADIVRTAVTPTWDQIGQLAAIAGIRTFLSFFLERDIELEVKRREAL